MQTVILAIGKSNISGMGLFSKSDIPAGKVLFQCFEVNDGNWSKEIEPANWLNHSTENNLSIVKNGNKLYFYTNKEIKKDEELSVNYSDMKKYNYPKNILAFKEDEAKHQLLYDAKRSVKPEMYNRPIGFEYKINLL